MTVWIQNPFDNLPEEGYRVQRYRLMAEAFVRAGHRVVCWTSDFSHSSKARRRLDPAIALPEGIELRMIPTPPYRRNVSFARIFSHLVYARRWFRLAKSEKCDLIVSSIPSVSGAVAAIRLGRRLGVRTVIDIQDAWPETFERLAPPPFRWLAHLLLLPVYIAARWVYRNADLVTGVSERYRKISGRDDFHLAYHGIGIGGVSPVRGAVPSGAGFRLVYIGAMGRTYDLATVVRAVEANEDFELDIAGSGTVDTDCPRVRQHGYLGSEELARLLADCEIGVIPMKAESWVGLPYKLGDYSRSGLGIVSSLEGETAALLARYGAGVTYAAGDADSFAAAVRKTRSLDAGASRRLCEAEFDSLRIYDGYVSRVLGLIASVA